MGLKKEAELFRHWNAVLCQENLGLIESTNQIFPETIVMSYKVIQLRRSANDWLSDFDDSKLEKIRYGIHRGTPNYLHKRVIELFCDGLSTREISSKLYGFGVHIGFQGVAKILRRYLK